MRANITIKSSPKFVCDLLLGRVYNGKSAYEYAKEKGFSGTEEEFANKMSQVGDAVNISRLQGKSPNNAPGDPFTLLLTMTGTWDEDHIQQLNEVLDNHHSTNPNHNKQGFFRIEISGTYLELISYPEVYLQDIWEQVLKGRIVINNNGKITLANEYNVVTRRLVNDVWSAWEYYGGGSTISNMKISGTVNLAKAEGKTTLQDAYNGLSVGEMAFYLVTDSNGLLPSPNQAYVTVDDSVRALFTTDSALGASVGDIVVVAKMKVLLVNTPVYRILPLNDAKAASGSFPGAMGLESPWDKKQVNLVPTALQFPTRGGENMNDCLEPGIYPWCTLGRPTGATGAFTLSVAKSTTADNAGYYTIEQTCYGREGETGRIFRRIIFQNASETQYNDWVEITGAGLEDGSVTTNKIAAKAVTKEKLADAVVNQLESIYYVYSLSITSLTADSSQEDIIAACGGSFGGLKDAIKASKDIVFSDAQSPDIGAIKLAPTFLRPDSYKVTAGVSDSITFVFGGNVNKEITIAWDSLRSKYTCSVNVISVPDGSITQEEIADNAIVTSKIANKSITSIKFADGILPRAVYITQGIYDLRARTDVTSEELAAVGLTYEKLIPTENGYIQNIVYTGNINIVFNIYEYNIYHIIRHIKFGYYDYSGDIGEMITITKGSNNLYSVTIDQR